jgi:hypothetical protein
LWSLEPNPGRPEYRYVITSKRLNFRQFQLRDADLAIFEREAAPVSKFRRAWWWVGDHKFLLIGSAAAIVIVALGISAFAEYHFKWESRQGKVVTLFTGIQGLDSKSAVATSGGTAGDSLFRYSGSDWTAVAHLDKYRVIDFFATDLKHVWLAATDGRIYFYDGKSITMQFDTNQLVGKEYWHDQILDIYAADATHVWAVGAYLASPSTNWGTKNMEKNAQGIIYFFDGTSWKAQFYIKNEKAALSTVDGADAQHVWAAGSAGTMYFFNGTKWDPEWESGRSVGKISVSDQGHAWAWCVDSNKASQICSYENGAWLRNENTDAVVVWDISGRSADSLWVSGTQGQSYKKVDARSQYAVIWTTDGAEWSPVDFPAGPDNTTGAVSAVKGGVWFVSSGKAWYGSKKLW